VIGMNCPYCTHLETKVTDSRDTGDFTIRRRRECLKCGKRFTTYERIEHSPIYVVKKDGRKEKYDREKVKKGIMRALEKRTNSSEDVEKMLDRIEKRIRQSGDEEVPSKVVGGFVMSELRDLDQVAYIRFASVYRSFADVTSFEEEVHNLIKNIEERKQQ